MTTRQTLDHAAAVQSDAAKRHARLTALILSELASVELLAASLPGYTTLTTPPSLAPFARQTDANFESFRTLATGVVIVWNWSIVHDASERSMTYGHALSLQAPPGPGQATLTIRRLQKDLAQVDANPWAFAIPHGSHTAFAANRDHLVASLPPESPDHGTARSALVTKLQAMQDFGDAATLKDDEAWLCIAAMLAVAKNPYAPPTDAA